MNRVRRTRPLADAVALPRGGPIGADPRDDEHTCANKTLLVPISVLILLIAVLWASSTWRCDNSPPRASRSPCAGGGPAELRSDGGGSVGLPETAATRWQHGLDSLEDRQSGAVGAARRGRSVCSACRWGMGMAAMNSSLATILADGVYIGGGVLLVILIVLVVLLLMRRGV